MKFYSTVLIAFLLLGLCLLEKRAKDQTIRKASDQLSESGLLADEDNTGANPGLRYNAKSQVVGDVQFTSMTMASDTNGSAGIAEKAILNLSAIKFVTSNQ